MKYSVAIRDARHASDEVVVGTSPIFQARSGSEPANCAAASTGTVLTQMTLPSDWLAAPSGGVSTKSGTWEDLSANNSGILGYFRLFDSALTTCHMQGRITVTGGGGDMTVADLNVTAGQAITVTQFTRTAGNA